MTRILIADSSDTWISRICPLLTKYQIEIAKTGPECVAKIASFQPDLIICELLLPHNHGIEILKKLKKNPDLKHIPVIITSYLDMVQNYHAAITSGASRFFYKMAPESDFIQMMDDFEQGNLENQTYTKFVKKCEDHCYLPKIHHPQNYLKFWGTRGSVPVSGSEYIQYGGNTSCLEVRSGDDMVIIDAGSGIRPLGDHLAKSDVQRVHLFIGHMHWDHITGFPFFAPLYNPNVEIHVWAPSGFEMSTRELFTNMLSYTYYPVHLDEIAAKIVFHQLHDQQPIQIGSITISTHYAYHPGPTHAFKIETSGQTIGYVTDNEALIDYHGHPAVITPHHPLLEPHESFIRFFSGCTRMIHEAQYSPKEYEDKAHWGHSSIPNAAALLRAIGATEWIVTHHDPSHTDTHLQKKLQLHKDILSDMAYPCEVMLAYDDLLLPL